MAVAQIEHIDVDGAGVARIAGKRTKVIQLIMDKMANGWDPEELHVQYPHLSLAQIYAAFAFYYDHQTELDAQIALDVSRADALRSLAPESAIVQKLRALNKLP